MKGLDYDLHSRILVSLAGVLADSRAKTTVDEVERLISKCITVPIVPMEDITVFTSSEVSIGRMTYRYQQTLDALVKYTVHAEDSKQVELVPRILSYLKHLPVYEWDDIILPKGYTTPDSTTYTLISGLLDLAFQQPELEEIIYKTLWNYGRCIIDLINTSNSKR
ncbi:uncharacterized protein EV154DRAFT_284863 [Mucor mucedo]|uniref:uncharacterized protein n=1 Tax=Mucor mucedo TaxID=29922 RepID=UPI002220CC15|nr:uncharacterized protein EV154DRAFT_284863 [Mucor mucedo]KAI7889363.1 hypothetical protein EV154DRAFT_284863 [Mucor mucedo]